MTEYEVDGTVREKECDKNSPISKLTTAKPDEKVYPVSTVIKKIKNGDTFWSYHYQNGKIDDKTKIKVEIVDDPDGKYLRTRKDKTEKNNLLELPIYHKNGEKYNPC